MTNIKKELEDFIIDNVQLEILESSLSKFNIFEKLSAEYNELKHSNTLAYLLNPIEDHGLNDYFLKKFLIFVTANNDVGNLSPIKIDSMDLRDAIIKREYRNIDLLIISKSNDFVCCIENKVLSSESENQLSKYLDIVNQEFRAYKHKMFMFLSPTGIEPSDPENWLIASYEYIEQILTNILEYKSKDIGQQQSMFIDHYCTIIRRYLLENSEEVKLANEIYNTHRTALDFIFKNISDQRQTFFELIKQIVAEDDNLHLCYSTQSRIRFTTKTLNEILPNIGDRSWNKMEQVFMYEIQNNVDKISMIFLFGPADDAYREKCFNQLNKGFIAKYLAYRTTLSTKFNTVYSKSIISKEDYEAMDLESLKEKIVQFFENDHTNLFREIDEYFVENKDYFQE
jgi:hypothetical protein